MNFLSGISYNLRGLWLGLKTPKLLVLGLIRFAAVVVITLISASLILVYHEEILHLVWAKPASQWILWFSNPVQCDYHGLHVCDYRTHSGRPRR